MGFTEVAVIQEQVWRGNTKKNETPKRDIKDNLLVLNVGNEGMTHNYEK